MKLINLLREIVIDPEPGTGRTFLPALHHGLVHYIDRLDLSDVDGINRYIYIDSPEMVKSFKTPPTGQEIADLVVGILRRRGITTEEQFAEMAGLTVHDIESSIDEILEYLTIVDGDNQYTLYLAAEGDSPIFPNLDIVYNTDV